MTAAKYLTGTSAAILALVQASPAEAARGSWFLTNGSSTSATNCRLTGITTAYYQTNDFAGTDYFRIALVDDNNVVLARSTTYFVPAGNVITAANINATLDIDTANLPSYSGNLYTVLQDVTGPSDTGGTLSTFNNSTTIAKTKLNTFDVFGAACKSMFIQNQAPLADAGADIANAVPGSLVTLDGSASSDPDNDAITYSWVQISGPAVTLDDATSPTPSFTAPGGAGSTPIIFQLTVNDGTVSSVVDIVTISFLDNIATAQALAGEFMVARNALLLAHQPDLQRRIDRLNGTARAGSANVAGISLPQASRLPLSVSAFNGNMAASTSLAAARGASTIKGSWDIWAEAYLVDHRFGARNGKAVIAYGGLDYALSDSLLVGMIGQYDEVEADKTVTTGVLDGQGLLVGPYVTARLAPDLYADLRASWGKSDNRISPFGTYVDGFDTERVLLAATVTGEFEAAPAFTIRPEAALHWVRDRQKSYVDTPGSTIPAQSFELGQLSVAPRAMYSFETANGSQIRPFAEARGIYNFGDRLGVISKRTHLRMEGGVDVLTSAGLRLSASGFVDGIGDSAWRASGLRASVGFTF
ncbi:MAG: autotransporter domain-containing protein [Sphingomonadaceae bacterium]